MQTRLVSSRISKVKTPLLAIAAPASPWKDPTVQEADKAVSGMLRRLAREEDWKGKPGQTLVATVARGLEASRVVLAGLEREGESPAERAQVFAARIGRLARAKGLGRFAIVVPEIDGLTLEETVRWCALGANLGVYRFELHKTGEGNGDREPSQCTLVVATRGRAAPVRIGTAQRAALRAGEAAAAGVRFARDLINEPPNVLTPTELARRAEAMAAEVGLEAKVLGPKEIRARGMRLLEAVSRGAKEQPRFIHLVHRPAVEPRAKLALVGKGITFDSGGLSLKPPKGQVDMKGDMGGAAVVLGAMRAMAELGLPYEVHGVVPATENMPGGNATRPGDVVVSMSGKSVEIVNTDAEGRLVLADALAYAAELEPDLVIDHATLTGACMVALGTNRAGLWATESEWTERYLAAAARAGEAVWRMPLAEELKDGLKSEVADMKNVGSSWGGAITAALFLREFAGKSPWIHVDIAGPSFLDKAHGVHPKGGTGFGVLSLLELLAS